MINTSKRLTLAAAVVLALCPAADLIGRAAGVTAPLVLDHNRMLVDAEVQAKNGTWRAARLWIDTGNPEFMVSEAFARSLGFDVPAAPSRAQAHASPVSLPPLAVRLNGVPLDLSA